MAPGPDPVLTSVGYLLLKAGVQMHVVIDEVLAQHDLTPREFLVLTYVGGDDPLSQQDLSRRLGLDPTIVVGLIDGLEARKAVTRTRDSADRRRYLLQLTSTGRKLQQRAARAMAGAEDTFLAPLAAGERDQLRGLLVQVMTPRLPWLQERDAASG
jgi:DNA-binding MarR family transcriptional regulator